MTSQVRLIATDMDGTLLGSDSRVSPGTARALGAAADAGLDIVVATGRSHWSAIPLLDGLDFIRWVICSNGATVYDREVGDVVLRRPIEGHLVEQTLAAAIGAFPELGVAYETPDGLVYSKTFRSNRESARAGFRYTPPPDSSAVKPTESIDQIASETVLKLLLAHPELVQLAWLDLLSPHLPTDLHVSTSGADFVEVCAPGADKGLALAVLCEELGVDAAHVAAFGDHANDLGMLTWAGYGYAMDNAHERVKAICTHIAPHHASDGVAQIVSTLHP